MKLKLKNITLKEETLKDIANKNINTIKFINYIKVRLNSVNKLINVKIESLSEEELYNYLKEIFDIIIEPKDYLNALSKKYNKHYTKFITIKTNMLDNDNNNIEFFGVSTPKIESYNNQRLSLKEIRKLTNSEEFLVIKEIKTQDSISQKEKYENHKYIDIDIDKNTLDEDSELYPYFIYLLKKDNRILVRDILFYLDVYTKELIYQAKSITKLSEDKDNQELQSIGRKYKKAYLEAFPDGKEKSKISANKHHRKIKYGGKHK